MNETVVDPDVQEVQTKHYRSVCKKLRVIALDEKLQVKPTQFLVRGLIQKNGVNSIAGHAKIGKTWILLQCGLAYAGTRQWWETRKHWHTGEFGQLVEKIIVRNEMPKLYSTYKLSEIATAKNEGKLD